jgi:ketosteroid isomerase-like protein
MFVRALMLLLIFTPLAGCADLPAEPASRERAPEVEAAVLAVLAAQVEAWNEGSLRGYMEGFARADDLRFASGGTVRTGWRSAFEAYQQSYPDRTAMGTLHFADLDVRVLSDRWAVVFGEWRLERASDQPSGLFTLLMERRPEGWRVVHDHTSSAG